MAYKVIKRHLNINEAWVLHSRNFLEKWCIHNNSDTRQDVTSIIQRNTNGRVWQYGGDRVTRVSELLGKLLEPEVSWANMKSQHYCLDLARSGYLALEIFTKKNSFAIFNFKFPMFFKSQTSPAISGFTHTQELIIGRKNK